MIKVEGMINKQPIAILIDSGASHNYINPNIVEIFHLERSKHNHSWMVQLAIGTVVTKKFKLLTPKHSSFVSKMALII